MKKGKGKKVEIKLGMKVEDVVTGFSGVATSRIVFLNGCIQFCVAPKVDKDGKPQESRFVDEARLKIVPKEKPVKVEKKPTGGGFREYPKQ